LLAEQFIREVAGNYGQSASKALNTQVGIYSIMCDLEAEQSARWLSNARARANEAREAYQHAVWTAREAKDTKMAEHYIAQRNYWMGVSTGLCVAQMSVGTGQIDELRDLIDSALKETAGLKPVNLAGTTMTCPRCENEMDYVPADKWNDQHFECEYCGRRSDKDNGDDDDESEAIERMEAGIAWAEKMAETPRDDGGWF
jgi:hypothetical protein